ncbi:MAG: hypothetical protein HS132_07055 [Planctomycetia bacterium]|nr:hypothetical protein [Planctomycetia bacterium]
MRSSDGGTNWTRKGNGFYAFGASSLGVHPTDPNFVLAAGGILREHFKPWTVFIKQQMVVITGQEYILLVTIQRVNGVIALYLQEVPFMQSRAIVEDLSHLLIMETHGLMFPKSGGGVALTGIGAHMI